MLTVDEINKLQQDIEAYKQSEQEATEIIAELKAENEKLKDEIESFENKLQLRMANDKESKEYWDDIFSVKDYPFNKENAYKELRDYYFVLQQLPEIYLEITGGILSKTTYFASSVIEAYHDVIDRRDDEIDNLQYKNNEYKQVLQEIKMIAEFHITQADSEDIQEDMKQIIDLITKAESEG